MTIYERTILRTDAVLNCIPIVNTVNNIAQALYKLALRVDTQNPVTPGLKTSIQIYILSKENLELFATAIPIFGNFFAFAKLALSICIGLDFVRGDPLMSAVLDNNQEIAHLCVGNGELENPARADLIFRQSASRSNNETFREILNGRQDWDSSTLLMGLLSPPLTPQNAHDILDFWRAQNKKISPNNLYHAMRVIQEFLKAGNTDLVDRVIDILPEGIPFDYLYSSSFLRDSSLLLNYLCPRYNYQGESLRTPLTAEQRDRLLAKSRKPSMNELFNYCDEISQRRQDQKIPEVDRFTYFNTMEQVLNMAELSSDDASQLIIHTLKRSYFGFARDFIQKYENRLTPNGKAAILKELFPSETYLSAQYSERIELFDSLVGEWKKDVADSAHQLYVDFSNFTKRGLQIASKASQLVAKSQYPSAESFQARFDEFAEILLNTFPGCDQAPEEVAI